MTNTRGKQLQDPTQPGPTAKNIILKIFNKCAGPSGCDVCRLHMEEDCLFFPELYRLSDEVLENGKTPDQKSLAHLLDLCTLCGLCPCPDVRMLILSAKAAMAGEKGRSLSGEILSDVQRLGQLGARFKKAADFLSHGKIQTTLLKRALKIHDKRELPILPEKPFFPRTKERRPALLTTRPGQPSGKVVYFAGCSAGYFFPEVARSAVRLLEDSGAEVHVPEQCCCSMPLLMEGYRQKALEKIKANVSELVKAVRSGYAFVSSCPTCVYFFKKVLLENAYFSPEAQEALNAGNNRMKVPSVSDKFLSLPKSIYGKILRDDGYFSSIDPLDRIDLSNAVMDLGRYLLSIQKKNRLIFGLDSAQTPFIYFAPCHLRELDIGQPYLEIFSSIPGTDIRQTGGALDCCGMAGHLGFKKSFHGASRDIGRPLFKKIAAEKHRTLLTDCLSCRMQFAHELPMEVYHPAQLLQVTRLFPGK